MSSGSLNPTHSLIQFSFTYINRQNACCYNWRLLSLHVTHSCICTFVKTNLDRWKITIHKLKRFEKVQSLVYAQKCFQQITRIKRRPTIILSHSIIFRCLISRHILHLIFLRMYYFHSIPKLPLGPVAPVAPVAPILPVNPGTPAVPASPVAPVSPVPPVDPGLPVTPGSPTAPCGPGAPGAPVSPTAPAPPDAPTVPGDPGWPGGPGCPVDPTRHRHTITTL